MQCFGCVAAAAAEHCNNTIACIVAGNRWIFVCHSVWHRTCHLCFGFYHSCTQSVAGLIPLLVLIPELNAVMMCFTKKARGVIRAHLGDMEHNLSYRIIQCYLPPDTWMHPVLTPAGQVGIQFTYPGGMEGWVDLGGWLYTERFACPQTVTHPSSNQAQCKATLLCNVFPSVVLHSREACNKIMNESSLSVLALVVCVCVKYLSSLVSFALVHVFVSYFISAGDLFSNFSPNSHCKNSQLCRTVSLFMSVLHEELHFTVHTWYCLIQI